MGGLRRVLLLVVLCACGRDLTLPPQALPPRIDAVAPLEGFAGDLVTITGANLADPSLQVFFDVRPAVIVTPEDQRDGHLLQVQVPADVLGADVSVTTSQGGAKSAQPFKYLGLGHPGTLALRATLPLGGQIVAAFPLPGGDTTALVDGRFGTLIARSSNSAMGSPAPVKAVNPVLVFGPPDAAWLVDSLVVETDLLQFDLEQDPPALLGKVHVDVGSDFGADGSPSGSRFATSNGTAVTLVALPSGTAVDIAVTGATADVEAVRFADDDTLIGVTANEAFRIDLGGASPVVSISTPFDVDEGAAFATATAIDPANRQFAYVGLDAVRILTWPAAGAPELPTTRIAPHVAPDTFAFSSDGARILLGDQGRGIVAVSDVVSGTLLGAQPLPGIHSIATVTTGTEGGFSLAATGDGVAVLFSDGRLLRKDVVDAGITSIAVDPVCGDILAATAFGPLRIAAGSFAIGVVPGPARLDAVSGGEGGVAGWDGADLYAWKPAVNCDGPGSFAKVARAKHVAVAAALSNDGNWVASTDDASLDLTPRSDGSGGQPQQLAFPVSGHARIAYHDNRLTATHPTGVTAAELTVGAFSTFAPGSLTEIATAPLDRSPDLLRWIRFASAWMATAAPANSASSTGTPLTFWSPAAGISATGDVPRSTTTPAGISADGSMLIGESSIANSWGLDTLVLQISKGRLVQHSGPHVDLPSQPIDIASSPDGARLYVSLPFTNAIAVIE